MKSPNNTTIQKKNRLVNAIISILILLPLCYLIYYNKIEKHEIYGLAKDTLSENIVSSPDSLAVKLKSAIDLAKSNPDEANYINLSLEYYHNGKYKECVVATKKAIQINPQSYTAYNNMCSAYNMLGYWDEAIDAGNKAIAIAPGNQLAINNLKASKDGKSRQDKSIVDAESLVRTSPGDKNYINLGNCYYSARKFSMAIQSFQKALTFNNKSVTAYNNICSAYNELGKWKEAAMNCNKALKIDSSYVLAKNNLKVAESNIK